MSKKKQTYKTEFIQSDNLKTIDDIDTIINDKIFGYKIVKTRKKISYYNIPVAFDTETTSFYYEGEKRCTMYVWTLGINGEVIYGRTWEDFITVINKLVNRLELSEDKRLIVYVHNLAFDFQFFRKWFNWKSVFSLDDRKPVKAVTTDGIEFRCSYILSSYSLATIGKNLQKYKVEKLVGDLDYRLLRHSKTPLSPQELKYCENDVRVVMSYIQEKIENDGDITRIPLTKTGYVRNYCRKSCMNDVNTDHKNSIKFHRYRRLMNVLTVTPAEYLQLKNAFQGGFTHANAFYSGYTMNNVGSYDFTSSYPTVMIAEQFPMSKAEKVDIRTTKQFIHNLKCYCCLFNIEFFGLQSKTCIEHPLSVSKCSELEDYTEDNGRLVEAGHCKTTLTEQDFIVINKFYTWQEFRIGTFRRYQKNYLPTDFVKAILKLYSDKTTLKGVEDKEVEYLCSKEMLNACYGMTVTDICRDEIIYDSEQNWSSEKVNIDEAIDKYNKSLKRFLFYPWGIWVTAYARKNLFTGIYEFKDDYIYSDTDSIKAKNIDKHKDYIDDYNRKVIDKLERALKFHNLPLELIRPKTIKGVEKPLGVWDFEGVYSKFRTLGAKRYIVAKNDEVSLTVSGVNKHTAIPYLTAKYGDKIFDAFTEDLKIPSYNDLGFPIYDKDGIEVDNPCGKNTHTYIDEEMNGTLTDYLGNTAYYYEKSGVHLEACDYSLSLSDKYIDYLIGLKDKK